MHKYIDLHLHCIAGVDDGASTIEEGLDLCRGLFRLGFGKVVATPHIRTAMFENRKPALELAYQLLRDAASNDRDMPQIELGAEHFWDDRFWELYNSGEALLFPGAKAILVEFPSEQIPLGVEQRFFRMLVRGIRPVLAHPERYFPLARNSRALEPVLKAGALPLLDIASLTGKYGRVPQRTAERLLEEGVYYGACTDSHKPNELEDIERSIERLRELAGQSQAITLLSEHPFNILEGRVGETGN